MSFKKILLVITLVAFMSFFAMSVSFAASSENLLINKNSFSSNENKKISNVEQIYTFKNNDPKDYLKISIKKNYQNKYKIKSVNLKYSVLDNKTQYVKDVFYKNYSGDNKNFLTIGILSNETINLDKITINYYTNGKIKHENQYPYLYTPGDDLKLVTHLSAKKANAKSVEKGVFATKSIIPVMKSQNVKIITKNKKYKIKAVKLSLVNIKNKSSYKIFKGYGKNSLKIKLHDNKFISGIKVYYY